MRFLLRILARPFDASPLYFCLGTTSLTFIIKVIINSEDFGADWRKVEDETDVYQLVCVRKDKDPGLQGFFYTFPDENEYDTKDLYKRHPTLPDHWIYYGRSDSELFAITYPAYFVSLRVNCPSQNKRPEPAVPLLYNIVESSWEL